MLSLADVVLELVAEDTKPESEDPIGRMKRDTAWSKLLVDALGLTQGQVYRQAHAPALVCLRDTLVTEQSTSAFKYVEWNGVVYLMKDIVKLSLERPLCFMADVPEGN